MAILPMMQFGGPLDVLPWIMWTFNKINAAQQLTIRNADGGGGHNRSFSKVYYISCLHTFLSEILGGKKPKNSHVTAKNVLCNLDF